MEHVNYKGEKSNFEIEKPGTQYLTKSSRLMSPIMRHSIPPVSCIKKDTKMHNLSLIISKHQTNSI